MLDAIKKAHSAICKLEYLENDPQDPPGTTIVAAVVQNLMVTIGWVGDSRAYWVGQANAGLLTRDHSWVNRVVDCGEMTEEEALRSAQAHEITQCIGPLETIISGQEPTASLNTFLLTPSSFLLLCSDGVWNYAPTANEFAKVVQQSPSFEALTICEVLVANAMSLGGRDNATVAVLCV
jgi:serine/threonine protein phosphatase PrpC